MEFLATIDGVGVCRNRFHISIHDPRLIDKAFCNNCQATVEKEGKLCKCCGESIKKKKEYKLQKIVLNNAIDNFEPFIISFVKFPTNGIILNQKWKYVTYAIPLECLALYYDTQEARLKTTGLPPWVKEIFKTEQLREIKAIGILEFIDKRIKAVGVF